MIQDIYYENFFLGKASKKKTLASRAIFEKHWSGTNTFYRLLDLVGSRFKPKEDSFPETMDFRFAELSTICDGHMGVGLYKDELVNGQICAGNKISRYGYYNSFQMVDYMGGTYGTYIPDLPGNIMPDAVMIFDSKYNVAPISRIKWYANRLTQLQGSINAAIMNLRGSVVINCRPEQKDAVTAAWTAAGDGIPVILDLNELAGGYPIKPEIMVNNMTGAILKQLQETYDKTFADFLTEFGINANGIINKLSGVSDMELEQNEQATEIAFNAALDMRNEGYQKVNKMFGTNIEIVPAFTQSFKNDTIEQEEVSDNDLSGTD